MKLAPVSKTTIADETFRCSARTSAHLRWTVAQLRKRHPKARLEIIQPCYNVGVKASAGTHDKDCAFDVEIDGLTWWNAQRFLRSCGWAAWFRHTGQWADESKWHIHMVSIPPGLTATPTTAQVRAAFQRIGLEVGEFVPGQVDDYYAHALGLKGQHRAGIDKSRFPDNINATVFKEDDVPYLDWPKKDREALVKDIVTGIFSHTMSPLGIKFGPAVQRILRILVNKP